MKNPVGPLLDAWRELSPELRSRWSWGLGLSCVALLFVFFLGTEAALLLSLAMALAGWHEYAKMMGLKQRHLFYWPGFAYIAFMMLHAYFMSPAQHFFWIWVLWISAFGQMFLEALLRRYDPSLFSGETPDAHANWRDFCRWILGIFYIFLIFGFIAPIMSVHRHGQQLMLLGLCVVFIGDSAAYFVGRKYGKTKLWPEFSPGKTWEGALGAMGGALVSSIIVWALFLLKAEHLGLGSCLLAALLASPLAQAGDLVESLMKRAAGIKDSGGLLGGHGGILDRTDGLALALPFIYYLFSI